MASTLQPQPQPQPAYILRGHSAPIHSTTFIRSNSRLVTGDGDGWIVVWSMAIKRPVAVWRAHEGAILGVMAWGEGRIITHGKDNKLVVWKLSEEDEESLSSILPVDTPPSPRKQPWILHILAVNTMNFCSFAWTPASASPSSSSPENENASTNEILIAVPNIMTSETVDIFHLPTTTRLHTLPKPPFNGGMIMALSIFHSPHSKNNNNNLTVITGHESGHTAVTHLSSTWQTTYVSNPHTQPVLSLAVSAERDFYVTSSADAVVAKHPIPTPTSTPTSAVNDSKPIKSVQTKHSGQQSLVLRNDGKIFATAGWDGRVRVYGTVKMKEVAVLKWHREGCYAVGFAEVGLEDEEVVKGGGTMGVKEERVWRARVGHWVVVGGKDGKVSLWDVY